MALSLAPHGRGVLPAQLLRKAIQDGWVASAGAPIDDSSIQPASIDLRLGDVGYRLQCSFLPDGEPIEKKLGRYTMGVVQLGEEGAVLEQNRAYLVPLLENLRLPPTVRAKANPKSSTGRLDVFTRVITDRGSSFDEIPAGYHGPLFMEIVPRAFAVRARAHLALGQLRLMVGRADLSDDEIVELHQRSPILVRGGQPARADSLSTSDGLLLGAHVGRPKGGEVIGYRAKENSGLIDLARANHYPSSAFWEEVVSGPGVRGRVILEPEKFYLLLSEDELRIPPEVAAEMVAYDPSSGELRAHYAGFFDPGFGWEDGLGDLRGSRAALEVRAHDVAFAVEHGQNICKLRFERMLEAPDRLYGQAISSNYQYQTTALGKHFRRSGRRTDSQPPLFN